MAAEAGATTRPAGRGAVMVLRGGSYGKRGGRSTRDAGNATSGSDLLFHVEMDHSGRRSTVQEDCQVGLQGSAVSDAFQHALQEWATPTNVFCVQVANNVRDIKNSPSLRRTGTFTSRFLAGALSELGHDVFVRTSVGGKNEQLFLELYHEFVVLTIEGSLPEENKTELVVEPNFREQFMIDRPTARYCQILELVPEVYVGTVERLGDLVQLLCQELARAFSATGRTLPPWRRSKSVISRWKPKIFKDEKVKQCPAVPAYPQPVPGLGRQGSTICSCRV